MSGTPMPSSFDGNTDFYEENRWQKFTRRIKEEPLIPLGCALTCFALYHASRSIKAGDHNRTNRMFRFRIYAQGFTIVAMVAGSMYWDADRKKRKEFESAVEERKMKQKNANWIKELEARDEEDKEIKRMRERRREMGAAANAPEKIKSAAKEVLGKTKKVAEKAVGKDDKEAETEKADEAIVANEAEGSQERKKGVLESVQSLLWGGKK